MKGGKPQVVGAVGCRTKADFGGAGGMGPPAVEEGVLSETRRQVFEGPQQKSDPTECVGASGVDPCRRVVCAEPFQEKGTAKGEKCDRENSSTVALPGGE